MKRFALFLLLVVCLTGSVSSADKPLAIRVPEGFTVELAAEAPLVDFPMMGCFDAKGRLFLAESTGLNLAPKELEEQLPNQIRMLEDTNGDGKYDRSTIFADKLTFPQGVLCYKNALYVASPPNIWRLEDTTGDGKADQREILVNQFGYTGNAASIHGCFLGPEGRIYWCDGYHGHEFRDKNNKITSKKIGSYIFSCKPDGGDVQVHCGGGMDNPVEVDFTEEGEMLGTVNILYTRPRIDCLVHWQYGGAYPHREQALSEMKVTGDVLGPIHKFGHVAVSGMSRYRSNSWGKDYQNSLFVTYFNSGEVKRISLKRKGSTFETTQHEFFSTNLPDFHPTDVLEDADGSLLVINTGAWFTRGCPTSQLAKPDIKGAIYRIRRTAAKPVIDPRGKKIDWKKSSHQAVVNLLDDDRFAVREQAIVECETRGKAIVASLAKNMKNKSVRSRRNTVWALTRIATSNSTDIALQAIRTALDDLDLSVRLAACQSIFTTADAQAVDQLMAALGDKSSALRTHAAKALGRIGNNTAVPALLTALNQNIERTEDHAIIFALLEIADPTSTALGLKSKSANTRRGTLLALDQMEKKTLTPQLVSSVIQSDDPMLQQTGLSVFLRHPEWDQAAVTLLSGFLKDEESIKQNEFLIRRLSNKFIKHKQIAELIGNSLASNQSSPFTKHLLLDCIGKPPTVPAYKSWFAPLNQLLASADQLTVEKTIAAVANIQTTSFNQPLQAIVADETQTKLLRASAWSAIHAGRKLNPDDFELVISMLEETASPAESTRAAQVINTARLDKEQLLELAPLLQQAGPLLLQSLLPVFQRTSDIEVRKTFLNTMSDARGLNTLSPPQFSDVIKKYPAELLPQANKILQKLKQNEADKLARIDTLLPHLKQGNAALGKKMFFSEKAKCSTCHRIKQQGGQIGPDLSAIGRIRKDRDFLEAIVFPSSNFVREYEPHTLLTTNGITYSGIIARETNDALFIQQSTGKPIAISREDIESIRPSTVSIMPNGLEKALTEKELADIIAYLRTLK